MFYYSLALNQGMCLCCDGMPDEYLIWGLSFFAMVTVWPAPLIWRILFLALISIEFKFLVSVRMYHIQRIQQIKRLFSVVSTPVYLLPLSLLSRWSYLCSSSWSALVLSACLVPVKIWFCCSGYLYRINAFSCCIALLFYDCISRCYPLYRKLLLFSWCFLAFFN